MPCNLFSLTQLKGKMCFFFNFFEGTFDFESKSCRLRWYNQLDPNTNINKRAFSEDRNCNG